MDRNTARSVTFAHKPISLATADRVIPENIVPKRHLGLWQATAINMIDMVGIGPFITLPMVIGLMNGPYFLYAWLAGACLSVIDAMVWSELGAAFPLAGGSYHFLKHAYGNTAAGRLMSFLFVWQTLIQAPLVIASASIGFAAYFSYLIPLSSFGSHAVSGATVLCIIALLLRRIEAIGKISVGLSVIVIGTISWIIGAGIAHGQFAQPIRHLNDGMHWDHSFVIVLGFASVKTVYSYLGYYNVCHLGGDIIHPTKNIPRSMFLSISGVTLLYLMMNVSVVSVIPWQEAKESPFVISLFMERLAGPAAAKAVTACILVIAFASVFSASLGYSRVPYAAARDGAFLKMFAKVHPRDQYPYVSILFLGSIAFVFSLFMKLSEVISAILAMRILVQFIGQALGLLVLHRSGRVDLPYRMPLYPWPVLLAIAMWGGILISTGWTMVLTGFGMMVLGAIVFLLTKRFSTARR